MSLEELEMKCASCGYCWVPRKHQPKKCPQCGAKLPHMTIKFMTKKQLFNNWIFLVFGGFLMLLIGGATAVMFTETVATILGLIGFLLMLNIAMPYYVEYRIYDLLHKPKTE